MSCVIVIKFENLIDEKISPTLSNKKKVKQITRNSSLCWEMIYSLVIMLCMLSLNCPLSLYLM